MSDLTYLLGTGVTGISGTASSSASNAELNGKIAIARAKSAVGEFSFWFVLRHGSIRELSIIGDTVSPSFSAVTRASKHSRRHVTALEDIILRRAARRSAKIISRGRFVAK